MYEDITVNALRYCSIVDILDVERMTLNEYHLRMKASKLSNLDDNFKIHLQAWKNQEVQATKGTGKNQKNYFDTFKKFFDYEGLQSEILGTKKENKGNTKQSKIIEMIRRSNSEIERG